MSSYIYTDPEARVYNAFGVLHEGDVVEYDPERDGALDHRFEPLSSTSTTPAGDQDKE